MSDDSQRKASEQVRKLYVQLETVSREALVLNMERLKLEGELQAAEKRLLALVKGV